MEKLTDRALSDFKIWLRNSQYGHTHYAGGVVCIDDSYVIAIERLHTCMQYAIVQEWFDTVNLRVYVKYSDNSNCWFAYLNDATICNLERDYAYLTRNEALEEAIKGANKLYNEKYNKAIACCTNSLNQE